MVFSRLLKQLNSHPPPEEALALLDSLSVLARSPKQILRYHELLLFTKAYPRSRELYKFSSRELQEFETRITRLTVQQRRDLEQTGIIGTDAYYSYFYPNACWLERELEDTVDIDWDAYEARDDDPLRALMSLWLTIPEVDAVDGSDIGTRKLFDLVRGKHTTLHWILSELSRRYDVNSSSQIYDSLALHLTLRLNRRTSRTTVDDGPPRKLVLWSPEAARAKFDFNAEVRRPLKLPSPVNMKRGRELLHLVHATLFCRLRELYPLTHGNPAEVYDVQFERGIRVVFWMMLPARRLPLEVGWDFLMLKNNVPIAYGGGGLIYNRLEHAINVFDTFRGGEAAWLFAQISRIAYSLNPAPWIVVRKFQLGGGGNTEGLKSGSYWFYDKLGFRSVDSACRKLADRERTLIAQNKSHRTPFALLKKFAHHDVVLSLTGESPANYREYPLGDIGLVATEALSQSRTHTLESFINSQRSTLKLTDREFTNAIQFSRLKTSKRETDYARALRLNMRLFDTLAEVRKSSK